MDTTSSWPPLPEGDAAYDTYIEEMRTEQYPMLKDSIYLDHAGTSLPNKATLDRLHTDLLANLHANPHSASTASQKTAQDIEDIRLELLRFVNASPETYDLVFTANATAGIKTVVEALREVPGGFNIGYHVDSHTSIVGMRELAAAARCVSDASMLSTWRQSLPEPSRALTTMFAYPAQSNMDGHRLPLKWCTEMQRSGVLTLLDAASFAPTARLDLDMVMPDFTVLSLNKIFGFPDLGALIIRKESAHIFQHRRYFGGGTVDMVVCGKEQWHMTRTSSVHEQLEDGSLPIHTILALGASMRAHASLFGSLDRISRHTMYLARRLHSRLSKMKHANGSAVAKIYSETTDSTESCMLQGPIVAFNLKDDQGQWVSNLEVEKIASIKNVQLRTGSVCNPGGTAQALQLEPWEMRQNFSAGYRCSGENDIFNGKPTGVIRASLGAMSTASDIDRFVQIIDESFVCHELPPVAVDMGNITSTVSLQIENLVVYPIKSCAGWVVPHDMQWDIRQEGLAWDREWCIVHQGTGDALSQKRHARMALVRPHLDFTSGQLLVRLADEAEFMVPLSINPAHVEREDCKSYSANVCNDTIEARRYISADIAQKLSAFIGVPCTLARFPASQSGQQSARHRKQHLRGAQSHMPQPLLLSNESPILTTTRSSLNALNETLKANGQRAAHYSVFRANIILAEPLQLRPGKERPWSEDHWEIMNIRSPDGSRTTTLENLGGCRRCQMVCVDQLTAERRPEVFLTLAKLRRIGGKVLFGIHSALYDSMQGSVKVGDLVDARCQLAAVAGAEADVESVML